MSLPIKRADSLQRKWDRRAQSYGNTLRGVLFQGLPDSINESIHHWHETLVCSYFAPLLPSDALIVDIGAGYGRLSARIQQRDAHSRLVGVDFSYAYSQSYATQIGSSICADIHDLPFASNSWDGMLLVTTLMYVDLERRKETIDQIVTVMKPGGVILIVDPSKEFIQLLRKLSSKYRSKTTGGEGFSQANYLNLFQREDCEILQKGSNSFFTYLLPLLLLTKRIPWLAYKLGQLALWLDKKIPMFTKLVLHRWILIRRV